MGIKSNAYFLQWLIFKKIKFLKKVNEIIQMFVSTGF